MFRAITSKTLTSASLRLVAKRAVLIQRNGLSLSAVKHDPEAPQSKLDEIFPLVEDFPSHHIGPRKWEAKAMLNELGYNVSSVARNGYFVECSVTKPIIGILFYRTLMNSLMLQFQKISD